MSEETTEQTAVEQTDETAQQVSEAADAQDEDLDQLLTEYESGTKAESIPEPKATAEADRVAQLESKVQQFEQMLTAREVNAALEDMAQQVKGDLQVSDRVVRGFIRDMAAEDPRLEDIFNNRASDPASFKRLVKSLGKSFAKEWSASQVDQAATEDREAVTQAVRGSSNKAPEGDAVPDFASMNDAEAREAMKKMGIQNPGF